VPNKKRALSKEGVMSSWAQGSQASTQSNTLLQINIISTMLMPQQAFPEDDQGL